MGNTIKYKLQELGSLRQMIDAVSGIRHVCLDMDGTIFIDNQVFPFTVPFLELLREKGINYSFLTNNPTLGVGEYVGKLRSMGIDASSDDIYTSSLSSIDFLKSEHPAARRIFLLGTDEMSAEYRSAGYELTSDSPSDIPDALVVSFDTGLTYSRLCRAAWWASKGVPYIATNIDRVCPTCSETVLVDCGSICKCIEHATGRRPDDVIGKPSPRMIECIMKRRGLQPGQTAMVGDRLYTDIRMGRDAGVLSVLVLSGETILSDIEEGSVRPDMIVDNIGELGRLLQS